MIGRVFVLVLAFVLPAVHARAQEEVQLAARDGVTVYGNFYGAAGEPRGTILLFHQVRSNRGEYATIAPELVKAGYNVLAIDQRAGGSAWGRLNMTAQSANPALSQVSGGSPYIKALADLEAALDYTVKRPARPIIAWGSGYSASLVFLLAASHPDTIDAVLAFSPAENFQGASVSEAAAQVKCPVFVTSSSDPGEIGDAKRVLEAAGGSVKTQLVPQHGLTGSTTLRREANPRGAAENWSAVEAFLARLGKKPAA